MMSRVFEAKRCGVSYAYVSKASVVWVPFSKREIREMYLKCANLRELACHFGISPLLARKLLSIAGIDFVRDLYNKYLAQRCCSSLARQNGMKPATLSKLFKKKGLKVFPRHSRPAIPSRSLQEIWHQTKTINSFARALGVHWQTASNIHSDSGLPAPEQPRKRLGRPPKLQRTE